MRMCKGHGGGIYALTPVNFNLRVYDWNQWLVDHDVVERTLRFLVILATFQLGTRTAWTTPAAPSKFLQTRSWRAVMRFAVQTTAVCSFTWVCGASDA